MSPRANRSILTRHVFYASVFAIKMNQQIYTDEYNHDRILVMLCTAWRKHRFWCADNSVMMTILESHWLTFKYKITCIIYIMRKTWGQPSLSSWWPLSVLYVRLCSKIDLLVWLTRVTYKHKFPPRYQTMGLIYQTAYEVFAGAFTREMGEKFIHLKKQKQKKKHNRLISKKSAYVCVGLYIRGLIHVRLLIA